MSKDGEIFIEADEMWTFSERKEKTHRYGLLLKGEQGLLLVLMSEKETMPELLPCGSHFLKTAKRTEYFSQRDWPLTEKYFLRKDTELSVKEAKKSHIERINLTFRQRVSALVMKTLSFSISIENSTSSVWMFINYHNDCILFC